MARLITSGYELREGVTGTATSPDGLSNGALETTTVRSGSASRKWSGAGSQSPGQWTLTAVTAGVDCFARTYVYVPTGGLPLAGQAVVALGSSGTPLAAIRVEADGTLTLWAFTGAWTQQGSASSPITLDSWENRVELKLNLGAGSVDSVDARLNGVSFASATGLAISDAQIAIAAVGAATTTANGGSNTAPGSAAFALYTDDVAVNDGSGAAQNTWPGSGKVALLRPTADSAVGAGWTLGNTTATGGNAWSRLDDAPPNSETDLTVAADADQIRNATSNANSSYDATMTTYTAAGVGAGATVNVVVPIVATGAPVVTSAKAGTVGVVSNPAITNVSLSAGGTSGAFWSGATIGTYPTGNKWSFGTTTYAPSVTLATAPVMRVTQVTASTRIAIVTEMGIYVDYTPAVVVTPPRTSTVVLQAVNRAANW